jgi:hypothetical protein
MKSNRILSFNKYVKIFEEDTKTSEESESPTVKTLNELISIFFKCYMAVATKAIDYKGVISDFLAITGEKDPAKRGEVMEKSIKNVTDKIDPKYSDLKADIEKAASSIKDLYSEVASTEEAKNNMEAINKMVNDKIISYQDILKSQPLKVETKEIKESRKIYGFDDYSRTLLYEKNTFSDEREVVLDKMKSIYSEMVAQEKNPSSDALKNRAKEVISKFDEYKKSLSNEEEWEKMKRRERKEKVESMNKEVDSIVQKTNELQKSELIKIGVDKKIADSMSNIISTINTIAEKTKEIDDKIITETNSKEKESEYKVGDIVKYKKENGEESQNEVLKIEGDKVFLKDKEGKEFSKDKKEIEGKVEGSKEKDKEEDKEEVKDIKSGNIDKENLKKNGPNYEAIKKFQEDYNSLGIGEKIGIDGGYGKNTESAVKRISGMIRSLSDKEIKTNDGKLLSGELISTVKKLLDNKDKIKGILK